MRLRREAGFTMVELVITMVVIGILAAIAVPAMHSQASKAIATEAMAMAGAIRTAERVWLTEHDSYTADWNNLSGSVDVATNKYFSTAPTLAASGSGDAATFSAQILGSGDAAGITVSVDQTGTVSIAGL